MTHKQISWEEFEETYRPIQNHISHRQEFNGWLFETYGKDLEYIEGLEANHEKYGAKNVWTIIDDDNGDSVIISGYHYVNRQGYIITDIPWEKDFSIEVIDK